MEIKVYRGVSSSNPSPLDPSREGEWGAGHYFSTDREGAEIYSDEVVVECLVKLDNPFMTVAEYDDDLIYELNYEAASLGFLSELFKGKRGLPDLIEEVRRTSRRALFGKLVTDEVLARGHDGVVADWGDGSKHVICYRSETILNVQNVYVEGKSILNSGPIAVEDLEKVLDRHMYGEEAA